MSAMHLQIKVGYIVWANEQLLYFGRSGKKKNGVIVYLKCGLGGIKDRLVNGH